MRLLNRTWGPEWIEKPLVSLSSSLFRLGWQAKLVAAHFVEFAEGECVARVTRKAPYLTPELQRDLTERIMNVEGHMRGVRRMLEEHRSCDRILVQMGALKAAIDEISIRLLDGHIECCVKEMDQGEEGKQAVESLRAALNKAIRNLRK